VNRRSRPAGLLLMGGNSRRFGRDKAWLPWAEGDGPTVPLWVRQRRLLAEVADPVWRAVRYGTPPAPDAWVDERPGEGPLPAIGRALAAGPEWWLVLAVDLPGARRELLESLWAARLEGGVTLPESSGIRQPLMAVWHRDVLPAVEALLGRGERRVETVLATVPTRVVSLPAHDPALTNVNTPEDWEPWHNEQR
jgi:molybdopterin-guanine dinucleotide biosynthesis protein A